MSATLALVAGEASGDALGADLIVELKRRQPDLKVAGVGGSRMAAAGVDSAVDISGLAILGFVEGLKAYPRVVKLADQTAAAVAASKPDAVVLIDSWGFTLRVAQRLGGLLPRTPLIKYIGPQVFATRPGRARTLAGVVDHLICIHDFEVPFYEPYGLPCTVCGHPAIGRFTPGDGEAFRAARGLSPDQRVVLVLPGSRGSEIRYTAPVLVSAAKALQDQDPGLVVMVVAAGPVEAGVRALIAASGLKAMVLSEDDDKSGAFAAATAAFAASGTVTTEVAMQQTPMVVAYRVAWASWTLMRLALKARWATLMNIAVNEEVVPEFLQTRATVDQLVDAMRPLLRDPNARARQLIGQNRALDRMGRGGRPAAEIAADTVEAIMKKGAAAVRRAPSPAKL